MKYLKLYSKIVLASLLFFSSSVIHSMEAGNELEQDYNVLIENSISMHDKSGYEVMERAFFESAPDLEDILFNGIIEKKRADIFIKRMFKLLEIGQKNKLKEIFNHFSLKNKMNVLCNLINCRSHCELANVKAVVENLLGELLTLCGVRELFWLEIYCTWHNFSILRLRHNYKSTENKKYAKL